MKILHAYNVSLLVYVPIFVFCLLLLIFFYDDKGAAEGEWIETIAILEGFPRHLDDGRSDDFKYSYDVNGKKYYGELQLSSKSQEHLMLRSFYGNGKVGHLTIFYDSKNPMVSTRSLINVETNWGLLILLFIPAIGSVYFLKRNYFSKK